MLLLTLVALSHAILQVDVHPRSGSASLRKRDTVSSLQQSNYYYWIEVDVGSPSQVVEGFIDTGSSDFWVATPDTCNTDPDGNLLYGTLEINCNYTFNPRGSDSLSRNTTSSDFSISYVSGKYANGFYGQDVMNIGGSDLSDVNFAIANNATGSPVLGIGYPYGESCVVWTPPPLQLAQSSCTPYNNFPMQLKEQGVIAKVAYSMWLNDANNGTGSVLFGGVDHTKYSDDYLTTVPIEKEVFSINHDTGDVIEYPEHTKVLVALTAIKIKNPDGDEETIMEGALPALIDSGTPTCMVPSSIVAAFYKVFGIYHGSTEAQGMPCGVPDNWYISFDFRGYQINVPIRQFIRPLLSSGKEVFDNKGNLVCSPGFESLDSYNYAIIGHNVMNSLYTVFDLEANEVAFGAAVFNPDNDTSSIDTISDSIPSTQQAARYSEGLNLGMSVTQSPQASIGLSVLNTLTGESTYEESLKTTLDGTSITLDHSMGTSGSGGLSLLDDSTTTEQYSTTTDDGGDALSSNQPLHTDDGTTPAGTTYGTTLTGEPSSNGALPNWKPFGTWVVFFTATLL